MLKYGNRDFRNLQEQVYANMKNIQDIIDGSNIIANFKTVNIVGQVSDDSELPDPDTYTGEYGDAILVGTDEDFDLYVFTKAYENENAPQWFNMGKFPQPGPQGPKGDKGEPGEGIKDASELLEFMEGSDAVSVALNQAETKVKVDLSAAEKAVIDNKLALPAEAPAATKIVAINTSKEQAAIGVGDGLEISSNNVVAKLGDGLQIGSNGEIKAKVGVGVEIDENGALSANIPDALVLPESAPSEQILVGVNTSNEQNAIKLADGEFIIDSDGKLTEYGLTLNFNNTTSLILTSDQVTAINAGKYEKIKIINYSAGNYAPIYLSRLVRISITDDNTTGFTVNRWDYNSTAGTNVYAVDTQTINASITSTNNQKEIQTLGIISGIIGGNNFIKLNIASNNAATLQQYDGKSGTSLITAASWTNYGDASDHDFNITPTITGTASSSRIPKMGNVQASRILTNLNWGVKDSSVMSSTGYVVLKGTGAVNNAGGANNIIQASGRYYDDVNSKIYDYHGTFNCSTGAYSITRTNAISGVVSIGEKTIYTNSTASTSLGDFTVYNDDILNKKYIEIPNSALDINVYDTSSNLLTISNKVIKDYKTNENAILKLEVKTDGTNYYLSGGLYEAATITLGFTKPVSAVSAIELVVKLTVANVDYKLAPDMLFTGAGLVNSIPVQYTGINRNTVTAIDCGSGSFIKLSGSEITFGADTSVSLDLYIEEKATKGITIS